MASTVLTTNFFIMYNIKDLIELTGLFSRPRPRPIDPKVLAYYEKNLYAGFDERYYLSSELEAVYDYAKDAHRSLLDPPHYGNFVSMAAAMNDARNIISNILEIMRKKNY